LCNKRGNKKIPIIKNLKQKIMSTKNNKTAKANNAVKKSQTANEEKKLIKINFDKHADKVQNLSEKSVSNQRSTIYVYPENFTALQINGKEGKNFRSKLRNELTKICGLIGLHYKMKKESELIAEVEKFDNFYKTNFKIQDYSINSLTNTKDEKNLFYVDMLNIIREVKGL